MKKAIVAVFIIALIILLTITGTLVISANKRSQDTINRIDTKIERYGK